MNGFKLVENEEIERNVNRVLDAINESLANLSVKTADWAKWDDTYKFIQDTNSAYINSNLHDESISDLQINIVLLFNNDGDLIFGREYKAESGCGATISDEMLKRFRKNKLLFEFESVDHFREGIMQLPGNPLLLTSRPITTSDGKGASRGTLVFGKYLDKNEISRLSSITHLSVSICLLTDTLETDVAAASKNISRTKPVFVNPFGKDRVAGYTVVKDIEDNPLLMVRIDTPRYIYQQGRITKMYLLISIVLSGLIFGLILNFSLEKIVISRLFSLNKDVKSISESANHSLKVGNSGHDELTFLSNSINDMLQSLHSSEVKLLDQNRQMRLIMDTLPSGLLSLNENFDINPEYSKTAESIFAQKSLEGKSFLHLLFPENSQNEQREKLFEFLDILRRDLFPEKELAALNPFPFITLTIGEELRWIKLCYQKIIRGPHLENHILVDIEDISAEKQLEQKIKQSEQENLQLKIIAEDPDLFRYFLSDMKEVISRARKNLALFLTDIKQIELLQEIFRDIHTIKGTASSFGLASIAEISGKMEKCFHSLKENNTIEIENISCATESLNQLSEEIQRVILDTRKILGEDFNDSNELFLRIPVNRINRLYSITEDAINGMSSQRFSEQEISKIKKEFLELRTVAVKKGLAKALKIVPELQKRFSTDIRFNLEGGDLLIDCVLAHQLNTPLIHLLRNAFVHGIESFEQRFISGKNNEGHISLCFEKLHNELQIRIADDGRGIDSQYVKQMAIKNGFISSEKADTFNKKQLLDLIFVQGFTTTETLNEISGRGVGMNAVYNTVVEKLNGTVEIESEPGVGTTFILKIPFNQEKIWSLPLY